MPASIWPETLASFCDDVAGSNPAPAAVAASAVTAALGLSLLIKVLEIAGKRKSFVGDPRLLKTLITLARHEAEALRLAADHDIAAVRLYLESRDPAAARNAIEVPMRAARAAGAGLDLCAEGATIQGVKQGLPAADLHAAAILLSAALRAILVSVEFNLRQLDSGETYREAIVAEKRALEERMEITLRAI